MISGMFDRRGIVKAAAGAIALPVFAGSAARSATSTARPNIIYIMADDLGFADLSCYGRSDYSTPNIDRLAKEGVKFEQAYANSSVCSATRIALMTGRYQYRLPAGLDEPLDDDQMGLPPDLPTLPSQLRQLGYETILIGKWHLGIPPDYGPLRSGYDRFFGIYGGVTDYFLHGEPIKGNPPIKTRLIEQDKIVESDGYITEVFGDRTVAEIRRNGGSRPFFLSLHFTAPHFPWQGPKDREVSEDLSSLLHFDGGSVEVYAEMVKSMDKQVGRLLDALDEIGLSDNTIVVFTSDNGGERFSNTWPLIGAKTELLEGGIRVPLLVRWPSGIPAGLVTSQTSITMDAVPTLLAAAGDPLGGDMVTDGANLLPILLGETGPYARELFWRYKGLEQSAFRDGDWKYLSIAGREYLFDLSRDQRERANLRDREPGRFDRMKRRFAEWNAQMLPYSILNRSYVNRENGAWADR